MAIRTANNQSLTEITELPSAVSVGSLVLLATETASSSATVSFTSNIDSTYDAYIFGFYGIHPATDGVQFQFNMSVDNGDNYNVTKTSSYFQSQQSEGGTTDFSYVGGNDLAQGTGFQDLGRYDGNDNDQSVSGYLHLFNPSSTTFVKHFISRISNAQEIGGNSYFGDSHIAGYGNTTSAVDAIQFKFNSGNTDAGVIKMYGVA